MTSRFTKAVVALVVSAGVLGGASANAAVYISNLKVICYDQNEIGHDEIYIKFNNTRVNAGDFSCGKRGYEVHNISVALTFPSFPIRHQIWESDGNHWWDTDDLFADCTMPVGYSYSTGNCWGYDGNINGNLYHYVDTFNVSVN